MNVWNVVCVCQITYPTSFSLVRKLLDFPRFYFDGICFIQYFREHLPPSVAVHCIFRNSLCNNTHHVTCVYNPLVRTGCYFSPFSFMDSL